MTHHLQRDLGLVDQVIKLSNEQRMTLLSHYEHNICRNVVWSLKVKYSNMISMNSLLNISFLHILCSDQN